MQANPETKIVTRPPSDYVGYTTIAEDVGGKIARVRLSVLQNGREGLTSELVQNPEFNQALDDLHSSLWPKRETLTPDQKDRLSQIRTSSRKLAIDILGRDITDEEAKKMGLDKIAESFFAISQETPALYLDFGRNLIDRSDELKTPTKNGPVYVFAGRDSFPFLLGFKEYLRRNKRDEKAVYAPFSRVGFQKFFGTEEMEKEFLNDLEEFYGKNSMSGSDMFVVDFGFIGSLERINQIILPKGIRADNMYHFLFMTFKKRGGEPWFLERLRSMGYSTQGDAQHTESETFGYLNKLIQDNPDNSELVEMLTGGLDPSIDWKPYLNPFALFMQEVGSGINETRQDNISRGDKRAYKGTHLKFASLQQFVGIYSFLEGLSFALRNYNGQINEESSINSLGFIFNLFQHNRDFFKHFIPQEDRRHLDIVSASPEFEKVTDSLEDLQTTPISTVKFRKKN